eukprot:2142755-Karenia_brevis.AAC.1
MKCNLFSDASSQDGRGAMPRRLGLLTSAVSRQIAASGKSTGLSGNHVVENKEPDLKERLLRDWAQGKTSSGQVQDYCRGAVVSGCSSSSAIED